VLKIVIVDPGYEAFLANHYGANPGLADTSYEQQQRALLDRSFGTGDAYSRNLRELGHEATELIPNCRPMQLKWAEERTLALPVSAKLRSARLNWGTFRRIFDAQIEELNPDVVYVQDVTYVERLRPRMLEETGRYLVAQVGSQPRGLEVLRRYDLVTTLVPPLVGRLRALGLEAEYLSAAFDEAVLARLEAVGVTTDAGAERPHPVSFVGSIHPDRVHGRGVQLLERLCSEVGLEVWGPIQGKVAGSSPIRSRYRGQAWGMDMYRVPAKSRIAVNRHGDFAAGHAANMRMFEATGVGALLMTESAANLPDFFEPGREVVAYDDADDLVEKIHHFLEHEDERRRIAAAGQRRTLGEHTYGRRISQLAEMLESRLRLAPGDASQSDPRPSEHAHHGPPDGGPLEPPD
jgi:spore maturation protein CgeB